MVKVENGKITQTSLPKHGYIAGRFVSTMVNHKNELLRDGWYEPEHRKPEYDPGYEKLYASGYSYDAKADKVYLDYTVIEKPEAVLKKQIEELKREITGTQDILISKQIITESEKEAIADDPVLKG